MNAEESRVLVERVQSGDATAVEDLLARHLPAVRAYVRLRVGPVLAGKESASDIVQSTCRDVLENLERFRYEGEGAFKAWLFTTAARKIADRAEYWSAQKREVGREASADVAVLDVYRSFCSPSQEAMGREALERVERAFERLEEGDREIILLARVAGLTHAEIGARLGLSEAGSRTRLFRALASLSEVLLQDARGK